MYYANDDVRLMEMAKPVIGDGEILVRIEASGISLFPADPRCRMSLFLRSGGGYMILQARNGAGSIEVGWPEKAPDHSPGEGGKGHDREVHAEDGCRQHGI